MLVFETRWGAYFMLLFHLLFALSQLIPDHSVACRELNAQVLQAALKGSICGFKPTSLHFPASMAPLW